jgi:formyltetrahydrofolate hydrolase
MDDNIGFHVEEKLEIKSEMVKLKDRFGLEMMKVNWRDRPKRMAIFVSKYDHCLVRRIELERYVEYFAP